MPHRSARVLVVDDDPHICDVLQFALEREGFSVVTRADGRAARDVVASGGVDLLVLDVLMPELDGLSLCREIRAGSRIPIIFVSSRTEETDRVVGLELGGDDYVTKPFSPRELVARVKSVLRRTAEPNASAAIIRYGSLQVDAGRHEVRVGAEIVPMTVTELGVLRAILAEEGRVLSRADLIRRAYHDETHVTERTIDTHVKRIRSKLKRYGLAPIETVHGLGYRAAELP